MPVISSGACLKCKRQYRVDATYDPYLLRPYFYERDGGGYCIACFLGVGPLDFPDSWDDRRDP